MRWSQQWLRSGFFAQYLLRRVRRSVMGRMTSPDQNQKINFFKAHDEFRDSLNAMMAAFRYEAEHHQGRDPEILTSASAILTHLDTAYAEAVWLNHKLERRVLNLDQ